MGIAEKIKEINQEIISCCERSQRNPREIRLLLATKTQPYEKILEAYQAGVVLYGENKAQELLEKSPKFSQMPVEWHFIGQLQSNKVKMILPYVTLIHSLDRWSLAEEIKKQAEVLDIKVNVLIEVNSSGEVNKGGISIDQCEAFIRKLSTLSRIQVQGLMTVAIDGSSEQVRDCFRRTRQCFEKVKPLIAGNILSMGMSSDYQIAIEEGSTLIRLGSSVFGQRS